MAEAAATSSNSKVSLKLFIDKTNKKVLFAEADKKAVDFLVHTLALPMGAFMFLTNKQTEGSVGSLYGSIENLSERYIQPNQSKDKILKFSAPAFVEPFKSSPFFVQPPTTHTQPEKVYYMCGSCYGCERFSDEPGVKCYSCKNPMNYKVNYIGPPRPAGEEGFVKGAVTYMVMDDLTVKPVSTVDLLKGLDGRDAETLEEKVVDIGQEEAMKLLSTILVSKTVLTDVFLSNIGSKPEVKTETEISVKKIPMKRVAKDLKRPKRPASAFFVFMDEFRKIYKENNPNNASANATGRAGGYKWKSMSDEEKAPYQAISDQMKVDYQNELAAYNKWLAEGLSPKNEELDNSWTEVNVREIQ